MFEIEQTETFAAWLSGLRDAQTRAIIAARVRRFAGGNLGDVKAISDGVIEARIHVGPGYRLYMIQRGKTLIVLLCGGDKRTQRRDIATALELAKGLDL